MAKPLDGVYTPDKRTLVKVKHERTADCAVAGYRIHKDGEGVGSLLLGLYDDAGRLNHVGVCAAFSVKFRRELREELAPLTENALEDHPWREWAEMQAHSEQRMPGGFSRWNVNKDLSFVPLRVERVVEVTNQARPDSVAVQPPGTLVVVGGAVVVVTNPAEVVGCSTTLTPTEPCGGKVVPAGTDPVVPASALATTNVARAPGCVPIAVEPTSSIVQVPGTSNGIPFSVGSTSVPAVLSGRSWRITFLPLSIGG
jgi:hypothetical protein